MARPSSRLSPHLDWEKKVGYPTTWVAGIDEVGRGCLAGPVVAGALILPSFIEIGPVDSDSFWLSEIADSKLLTPEKREELAPRIEVWALSFGIGVATVEEIDDINIYHASHLAMKRALESALARVRALRALTQEIHALIDGNALPKNLSVRSTAVVKGDLQCLSIAAASVLAKVWRDRLMRDMESVYPGYGFGVHKGYSTPEHGRALDSLGPCLIHRRSFAPVAKFFSAQQEFSLV